MRKRKRSQRAKKRRASNDDADNDSFYSAEYDDEGTSRSWRMSKLSRNPIVAIVQRSKRQRGVQVTALAGHKSLKADMRRFLEAVFGREAIYEEGLILFEALVDGD